MSRYRGPKLRITRRLGDLPGLTTKQSQRKNAPGEHGAKRRRLSPYAIRLQEKQKLRLHYGLTEKQLQKYVRISKRKSKNVPQFGTGEFLLEHLERRLDSTLYRLKFAPTIQSARQLVNHGLVQVNGKKVDIPSYQCYEGEQISLKKNIFNCEKLVQPFSLWESYETQRNPDIKQLLIIEYYSNIS